MRGCDAAAKSFICLAKGLSINEVVKGGTYVAVEKERFLTFEFVLAGFPSFIY